MLLRPRDPTTFDTLGATQEVSEASCVAREITCLTVSVRVRLQGGAIYNGGTLTMTGCEFHSNTAVSLLLCGSRLAQHWLTLNAFLLICYTGCYTGRK